MLFVDDVEGYPQSQGQGIVWRDQILSTDLVNRPKKTYFKLILFWKIIDLDV